MATFITMPHHTSIATSIEASLVASEEKTLHTICGCLAGAAGRELAVQLNTLSALAVWSEVVFDGSKSMILKMKAKTPLVIIKNDENAYKPEDVPRGASQCSHSCIFYVMPIHRGRILRLTAGLPPVQTPHS